MKHQAIPARPGRRSRPPAGTRTGADRGWAPNLRCAVEHIFTTTPPAHLVELYYWAQEPWLLRAIRGLVSLSSKSREVLIPTLELLASGSQVTAIQDGDGHLILKVAKTVEK